MAKQKFGQSADFTKSPQTINKGLFADNTERFQPKETYRFALNAVLESESGNYGSVINERSNEPCAAIPEGYTVVGTIPLFDDDFVVFLAGATDSIIALQDNCCVLTTLIKSSCLGFDSCNPVTGEAKIMHGCERVIYFNDGVNPDKRINIDRLEDYVTKTCFDAFETCDVFPITTTPDNIFAQLLGPSFESVFTMALDGGGNAGFRELRLTFNYPTTLYNGSLTVLNVTVTDALVGVNQDPFIGNNLQPAPAPVNGYVEIVSDTEVIIRIKESAFVIVKTFIVTVEVAITETLSGGNTIVLEQRASWGGFYVNPTDPISIYLGYAEGWGAPLNGTGIVHTDGRTYGYSIFTPFNYTQAVNCQDIILDCIKPSNELANTNDLWLCSKMKLCPDFKYPCIQLSNILNTGGKLKYGAYQFSIQYGDRDKNFTHWISPTPPIPIVDGDYGAEYAIISGSDALSKPPTSKAIELSFSRIDTQYDYIRIAVLITINGTTSAYEVATVPISGRMLFKYVFRGVDEVEDATLDVGDIAVPRLCYETSNDMAQASNRLLRVGVTEKDVNYAELQAAANDICVRYFTTAVKAESSVQADSSVKTGQYYYDHRSYMRDEVYALGIVWIFNDGTTSPAFHIPGRLPNMAPPCSPFGGGSVLGFSAQGDSNEHSRGPANDPLLWDTCNVVEGENAAHLNEVNTPTIVLPRWKVYNTAVRTNGPFVEAFTSMAQSYTEGELAYWESADNTYPFTKTCDDAYIYGSNVGLPLRHHKMPDTTLEPHFLGAGEAGNEVSTILPLGLKFSNVVTPASIKDKVQGWKIVRAQRTVDNRTIVDKGIIYDSYYIHGETYKIYSSAVDEAGTYDKFLTQPSSYNEHRVSVIQGFANGSAGLLPMFWLNNNKAFDPDCVDCTIGAYTLSGRYQDVQLFHSPEVAFNTNYLGGSNIKFERALSGNTVYTPFRTNNSTTLGGLADGAGVPDANAYEFSSILPYNRSYIPELYLTNRKIRGQARIGANNLLVKGELDYSFINKNQQDILALKVQEIPYAGSAVSNGLTPIPEDSSLFNGIGVAWYVSLKKNNANIYGSLENIEYIEVSNCIRQDVTTPVSEFGGDIFITRHADRTTFVGDDTEAYAAGKLDFFSLAVDAMEIDVPDISAEFCTPIFWTESVINTELRSQGESDDLCAKFYPKTLDNNFPNLDKTVVLNSVEYQQDVNSEDNLAAPTPRIPFVGSVFSVTLSRFFDNTYCKNYNVYNSDYSKENIERTHFPLAETFNYCTDCANSYPNRIVYSDVSFQDDIFDAYLSNPASQFVDIPANTGNITTVVVNRDTLHIITDKGLWQIQDKPSQIESKEGSIFLGTGGFLSLPPRQVVTADHGYGGTQHKYSIVTTEYGTLYVDSKAGKVFLLGEGLEEISKVGLRNWLRDNLKMLLLDTIKDYVDVDCICQDAITDPSGIGIQSSYDPMHRRLILHKKDYVVLDPLVTFDELGLNMRCVDGEWHITEEYIDPETEEVIPCGCPPGFTAVEMDTICQQITGLDKNTNIYAFFDITSLAFCDAAVAHKVLTEWFAGYVLANDYKGSLYTIPVNYEAWLSWASYPWTGTLENGSAANISVDGAEAPNFLTYVQDVNAGSNTFGNVLFTKARIPFPLCPSPYDGYEQWIDLTMLPPGADPLTGAFAGGDTNVLVIAFCDEASSSSYQKYPTSPLYHDQDCNLTDYIFNGGILGNSRSTSEPVGTTNDWIGYDQETPGVVNPLYQRRELNTTWSAGTPTGIDGDPFTGQTASQPTLPYQKDFIAFLSAYSNYTSFKGFLYPIVRSDSDEIIDDFGATTFPWNQAPADRVTFAGKKFLLHTMGAVYAGLNSGIASPTGVWNESINGFLPVNPANVNLGAMLLSNPYTAMANPNAYPNTYAAIVASALSTGTFRGPGLYEYGWRVAADVAAPVDEALEDRFILDLEAFLESEEATITELPCNTVIVVPYERPDIFEDKSWTLSFSFEHKAWASYHSYQPNWMFFDRDTFYTYAVQFPFTWRHNMDHSYQTFYGTKYDHIIEYVMNVSPAAEIRFTSLQYLSHTQQYIAANDYYVDVDTDTFDRVVMYTSHQSTGQKTLVRNTNPYNHINYTPASILIDRTNSYWKFNYIRDMVIDTGEPLFTKSWLEPTYQAHYQNGQGYIDKVVNPASIDMTKSVYNQGRIRGTFAVIRLYFKSAADYRIITDILATLAAESIR